NIGALYSGPYQLTVTDANSCTSVESFTVTEPAALSLSTTTNKADCSVADGFASVSVSGGASPYSYLWSNGSTTNNDPNVLAGVYNVTVTDNNGCIDSAHASVSNKTGPAVMITIT